LKVAVIRLYLGHPAIHKQIERVKSARLGTN